MIEFINAAGEFAFDERGLALSTWVLSVVTAFDARVGIRIYQRATVLINILTGKVRKVQPKEITPTEPAPAKAQNAGHWN
jgi:hypothetical protein